MPRFGRNSESHLETADERIQLVLREGIKVIDFYVLCCFRDEEDQNLALALGNSTKQWPDGKHNIGPPTPAVDIAPCVPGVRIDWKDLPAFARLIGFLEHIAYVNGIPTRWGGDWNQNYRTVDERLVHLGHLELDDVVTN